MDHRDGGEDGKARAEDEAKKREAERFSRQQASRLEHPWLALAMDAVESGAAPALERALEQARAAGAGQGWIDGRMLWRDALALSGLGFGAVSDNPWPASLVDLAAARGHVEALSVLERWGAKLDEADDTGRTPLSRAAAFAQEGALAWLLERGANPNGPGLGSLSGKVWGVHGGFSPLAMAAEVGAAGCVQRLLDGGADPDMRSAAGDGPLFTACYAGDLGAVELLSRWADHSATGAAGETAFNLFGPRWGETPEGQKLLLALSAGRAAQESRQIEKSAHAGAPSSKARL